MQERFRDFLSEFQSLKERERVSEERERAKVWQYIRIVSDCEQKDIIMREKLLNEKDSLRSVR